MSRARRFISRIFGSVSQGDGSESSKGTQRATRPPTRTQREICERIGLSIPAQLGSREVHALIQQSLSDPTKQRLFEQYEAEQRAASDKEAREELGAELFEQVQRWEAFSDAGGQYLVTFQRGESTHVDIVEFDPPDVDPERRRSPLKICLLLPKLYKDADTGSYLEWEREVSLTPDKIFSIEKLHPEVDLFDVEGYKARIAKAS